MRMPSAVSPTSLHLWETEREEFYKKYLADNKPPHVVQSEAMSVGSAFDAYVKSALHHHLFGNDGDGEFALDTLIETQVDEECRPFARAAGEECFARYRICGCYDELLQELLLSEEDPRFEFKLEMEIGGVPMVGKPDLWYKRDVQVVYDWKVMGYCSRHAQSPKKFHKSCRDTWEPTTTIKATRGGGQSKPHKGYEEMDHHGHKIGSHWLEDTDKRWADQIAIYSWMLGVEVGDESMVTGLDQLACKPHPDEGQPPLIRVAQHRCRISSFWQHSLLKRLQDCWKTLQSGHIFDDLSREDSDSRCEVLDMPQPEDDDQDDLWAMVNERTYRG